jgi:hypothetical protein
MSRGKGRASEKERKREGGKGGKVERERQRGKRKGKGRTGKQEATRRREKGGRKGGTDRREEDERREAIRRNEPKGRRKYRVQYRKRRSKFVRSHIILKNRCKQNVCTLQIRTPRKTRSANLALSFTVQIQTQNCNWIHAITLIDDSSMAF